MNFSLTRCDYEEFLINAYFVGLPSEKPDYLESCAQTAYLDVCRTLRDISKVECKDELRRKAIDYIKQRLAALGGGHTKLRTQAEFNAWHEETCVQLSKIYEGHYTLYIGQAQKWVNMTFKYIFTMGEGRLRGYSDVYQFCHAPIDGVLIDRLSREGIPRPEGIWSQIREYRDYLGYQQQIRQRFGDVPLLDVEFWLWLGKPLDRLGKDDVMSTDPSLR